MSDILLVTTVLTAGIGHINIFMVYQFIISYHRHIFIIGIIVRDTYCKGHM